MAVFCGADTLQRDLLPPEQSGGSCTSSKWGVKDPVVGHCAQGSIAKKTMCTLRGPGLQPATESVVGHCTHSIVIEKRQ